jgi:hypothetical protein
MSAFPPTPTGWTVVDAGHDLTFQITVVDETTRNLVATVKTTSTGTVLATAALDKSGKGSITFSDAAVDPILNWVIAEKAP